MSGTLQRVEPAYWHLADLAATDGDLVADLCDQAAYGPDPEQRALLNGIFARDEAGRSLAFAIGVIAARRNLKTAVAIQACLGWLFLFDVDPIVWTAHEWDTVEEQVRQIDEIISGWAWLRRQVRTFSRAQRDQYIVTRRGGRMLFRTRTPGGGRGLDGEKVVLDEAWKCRDAHIGSLMPLMSARSMTGDPQILYGSSAAHADSEVLHPLIERGRLAATDPRVAALERRLMYAEWCAPGPEVACDQGLACKHALDTPGCGCDKAQYLRMANPALDRRISLEFIQTAERRNMPAAEFARERMGWHDAALGQAQVIPLAEWAAGLDAGSEPVGPVALGLAYTWDKKQAAIGLAGRRGDGGWHVEVADVVDTPVAVTRVSKIVTRAAARGRDCVGVAVDKGGFEAEAIPALMRARADVTAMSTQDVAAAFTGFFTSVTADHDLWHRGQDALTLALAGAASRRVGDAGEAWGRRASGVDIAPLVAVTAARWLHDLKAPVTDAEPEAWVL